MNTGMRYTFGAKPTGHNTYIGGIGSVVDTPAKLAEIIFDINNNDADVSNILNFEVINNDIRCYIDVRYTLRGDAFNCFSTGNSGLWYNLYGDLPILTHYVDYEGMCKTTVDQDFQGQVNLDFVYFPNFEEARGVQTFRQTKLLLAYINGTLTFFGNRLAYRDLYFSQIGSSSPKLYCPMSMQTNNNGNVDLDVQDFIDNQNGTVTYLIGNEIPTEVQTKLNAIV